MAATGTPTPNIGLRRAQGTDPASVDDINYNSALIDTKLGAVGNSSVQDQIDTLNGNITTLNGKTLLVKKVELPLSTLGTSWSPTSRLIGTTDNLFGLGATKIVSIMMTGASFSPAANSVFGLFNNSVYVAATQATTLSDRASATREIRIVYEP